MANRITTLFDLDSKGFDSSLKTLRKNISEADGAVNKSKVAGGGLKAALQENIGAAAFAAGAALVGLGIKAVSAFNETALAAGAFSDATGISVEAASRWKEVGGDVGIGADSIEGAIRKMNLALANGKPVMDEFKDSIVLAKNGTIDANATFQNLVTKIGAIEDPTKRAKAAQEAFGKGYGDIARLMEMSAGDLEAALRGVSESKVIDQGELEKARGFQAAMDTLKDSVEDVALNVGGRLTPLITALATALDALKTGAEEVDDSPFGFMLDGWGDIADSVKYRFGELTDGLGITSDIAVKFEGNLKDLGSEAKDADPKIRTFSDAVATAAIDAKEAAKYTERLETLLGELDDEAATLSLEQTFIDLRTTAEEAFVAAVKGSEDAAQKQRDYQVELNGTKQKILEYATEVANLPADYVTQIAAQLDEGNIAAVESALFWLTRGRTVRINGQLVGADLRNAIEGRAMGGPVSAGQPYLVGERGPELVVPSGNGNVIPAGKTASMMGGSTTVNIYTNADPNSTKAALRRFDRRNGPGL